MDLFPTNTGSGSNEEMGYFDGNTVTGLWNYAQFYAMSDNSYGTTFGPSSPGCGPTWFRGRPMASPKP